MFPYTDNTAFVSREANQVFGKRIFGGAPYDDTFVGTLRALLIDKLPENNAVVFNYDSGSYDRAVISRYVKNTSTYEYNDEAPDLLKCFYNIDDLYSQLDGRGFTGDEFGDVHFVHLCEIRGVSETRDVNMAFLSNFATVNTGFKKVDRVTEFFKKQMNVLAFVNEEEHISVIFAAGLNESLYHYLQCAIPVVMPWFFTGDNALTQDDIELLASLRERRPDKYVDITNRMAKKYDFRTYKIKNYLRGFETMTLRRSLQEYQSKVDQSVYDIQNYLESIGNLIRRKEEAEAMVLGLTNKINAYDPEESEMMEYFLANKSIEIEDCTEDLFTFTTCGYLEYFDEDAAEALIKNNRSVAYYPRPYSGTNYDAIIPAADMKRLLKEIFVERNLRVKFCSAYRLNMRRNNVAGLQSYNYPSTLNQYMPNPHIDRFECIGSYTQVIIQALTSGNTVLAIEQCCASGKSLNFHDGAVLAEFFDRIYVNDRFRRIKCVEFPDGTMRSFAESAKYLRDMEEAKNE